MIEGNAKLIVDLGNSETRVMTMFGKNKGVSRRKVSAAPNRYAAYDPSVVVQEKIAKNSFVFETEGIVNDIEETGTFVSGAVVPREYASRMIRPSSVEKKYKALTTLLALNMALFRGYESIAKMTGADVEDIDVEWDITVLIPPADIAHGSESMAQLIRSIKKIKFTLPYDLERDINIREGGVNVFAEGHSAFIGVLMSKDAQYRDGYDHLASDNILVADIGAGTTDFLIIREGDVIEETKFTMNTGGNNVVQSLAQSMKKQGYDFKESDYQSARSVMTGTIRDGAKQLDLVEEVKSAKERVAATLSSGLRDFFEVSSIDPRSINWLLVVGGGTMRAENENIEPLSDFLVNQMQGYSPNIGLVPPPKDKVKDRETDEVVDKEVNPRLLNINGAGTLSEIMG